MRVFEVIFVALIIVKAWDEGFPRARRIDFAEFVFADIPAIPLANEGHIVRHRGVESKPNTFLLRHDFFLAFAAVFKSRFHHRFGFLDAKMSAEVIESANGLAHQIVIENTICHGDPNGSLSVPEG